MQFKTSLETELCLFLIIYFCWLCYCLDLPDVYDVFSVVMFSASATLKPKIVAGDPPFSFLSLPFPFCISFLSSLSPFRSFSSRWSKVWGITPGTFFLKFYMLQVSFSAFWDTVKLCYNVLAYNISSVIAYTSSRSQHFSVQNVSVITCLDVTYPWILQTDFWAQTLQRTPASTYVHPPSRRLCSWLQSITGSRCDTLMPSACRPV